MLVLIGLLFCLGPGDDLPEQVVTRDDTVIRKSCVIRIPEGAVIEDANGDGVLQIVGSNLEVRFASGTVLRGANVGRAPDEYGGVGIRVVGARNVRLSGVQVSGYHCGVWATGSDGLTLEDCEGSDNRRARLRSTPEAEDGADWLSPHKNDANEWLDNYGAAFYVEDSSHVVVRRCRVRNGQNGLCLDGVTHAEVYDNDFSFLSGWGVALWRSSRNVVSRNALDFCMRGYSHGIYNRGQDSAGILAFEQCSHNVFAENSATHSGDGFFAFAGLEALGDGAEHPPEWYRRRGNNQNLLVGNDFSYAAAHGIEMTFSFDNRFHGNRVVENAICGVWGGYSQDTWITGNLFEGNGDRGYGLERGGVNVEHGRGIRVVGNQFRRNRCGVHFWWDPDGDFGKKPWARMNGTDSRDNVIAGNSFEEDELAYHFRGPGSVTVGSNQTVKVVKELERDKEHELFRRGDTSSALPKRPDYPVHGETRPVGARPELRGRRNIIMTEWTPWDHRSPLARRVGGASGRHDYELRQMPADLEVTLRGDGVEGQLDPAAAIRRYSVTAPQPGVYPYTIDLSGSDYAERLEGIHVVTRWTTTFFRWTKNEDPRENLEAWRALAKSTEAVEVELPELRLPFGSAGPGARGLSDEVDGAELGKDHFGLVARTRVRLPAGRWRFATVSDDGVRVRVDGKPVVENWTWHGPTRDIGFVDLDEAHTVEIVVEHFEIDGYAVLDLEIAPANPKR